MNRAFVIVYDGREYRHTQMPTLERHIEGRRGVAAIVKMRDGASVRRVRVLGKRQEAALLPVLAEGHGRTFWEAWGNAIAQLEGGR